MTKYQLTTQDRAKGGKRRAETSDMRELGKRGLKSFADKYFAGDIKTAGETLSKIGNWYTDPARWNGAFRFPENAPPELKDRVVRKLKSSDVEVPF